MLSPLPSAPVSSSWSMLPWALSLKENSGPPFVDFSNLESQWFPERKTNPLCQRRWTAQPFAKTNISSVLSRESKRLQELFVFVSFKELMNMPSRTNILREGWGVAALGALYLASHSYSRHHLSGNWGHLSIVVLPVFWGWSSVGAARATNTWGLELASLVRLAVHSNKSWVFRENWAHAYGGLWYPWQPSTTDNLGLIVLCCEGLSCPLSDVRRHLWASPNKCQ